MGTVTDRDGYIRVRLFKYGKRKQFLMHRLVAFAFIGKPNSDQQINHINGVKDDNRVENLEWCTIQENIEHSIKNGLKKCALGEKHGNTKLKNMEVLEINQLLLNGVRQIDIAKKFKTSRGIISNINLGKTWGWLTGR